MTREELIEKHILKDLNSKEKIEFETLLKSDPDFKEEVAFHMDLQKSIKKEDEANFRSYINALEQNSPKSSFRNRSYVKWLAAASVILIVGLSYLFYDAPKSNSNELFESLL